MARQAWHDLQPHPGRWAMTWRTATLCALAALVFMTYQIPLAAIGCYLIFFVLKPQATESIVMGLAVLVLVSIVVGLLLLLGDATLEHSAWRLAIIVLASMLFMFLAAASQVGHVGSILALVVAFAVTLFSDVPLAEVFTRGVLYAWLMAATPMAILIVFNLVFGQNPNRLLRAQLAERLELCAECLESDRLEGSSAAPDGPDDDPATLPTALREALDEGNADMVKGPLLMRLLHVRPAAETRYLAQAAEASYQTLLATAAWWDSRRVERETVRSETAEGQPSVDAKPASDTPLAAQDTALALAARLRQRAQALRTGETPTDQGSAPTPAADTHPSAGTPQLNPTRTDAEATVASAEPSPAQGSASATAAALASLSRSLEVLDGKREPLADDRPAAAPFFLPDAFTNPDYTRYALKTTAAAVIAYLIYTAIDWQDIHTAMITCYVVALGTTAETIHKLTLRIIGCLTGAAMGIASVHVVIPMLSDVGGLMILVFIGTLIAAWVASGPERIAYAGVQVALAFLLTVLQGFGPDPDISIAMDRIYGVLLGNVIVFVVFTSVWPARATDAVRRNLADVGRQLGQLAQLPATHERQRTAAAAALQQSLGQTRDTLRLAGFEPRSQRPDPDTWHQMRQLTDQAEALTARLSLPDSDPATGDLAPRLAAWHHHRNRLAS